MHATSMFPSLSCTVLHVHYGRLAVIRGKIVERGLVEECLRLFGQGVKYYSISVHLWKHHGLRIGHRSVENTIKQALREPAYARALDDGGAACLQRLHGDDAIADEIAPPATAEHAAERAVSRGALTQKRSARVQKYDGTVDDDRAMLTDISRRMRDAVLAGHECISVPIWVARSLSSRVEAAYDGNLRDSMDCAAMTKPGPLNDPAENPDRYVDVFLVASVADRARLAARIVDILKFRYGQRVLLEGDGGVEFAANAQGANGAAGKAGKQGTAKGRGANATRPAADALGELTDAALVHILAGGALPPDGTGHDQAETVGALEEVADLRRDALRLPSRGAQGIAGGAAGVAAIEAEICDEDEGEE